MTDEEAAAIKARAEAATPGPWTTDTVERWYVFPPTGSTEVAEALARATRVEDAAFIAHAREDIPALLDEVERLRGIEQMQHRELLALLTIIDGMSKGHTRIIANRAVDEHGNEYPIIVETARGQDLPDTPTPSQTDC